MLVYFENQKILLPSYRTIQDMFTKAFSKENKRIEKLIQLIPQEQQEKLSNLIKREEEVSKFNVIRADQKNFKYTPINEESVKAAEILNLYAEKIANQFGYKKIPVYCDDHLDEVLDELDRAWDKTTNRINRGENPSFKIKETKSGEQDWSLGYDSVEKLEDSFFKT